MSRKENLFVRLTIAGALALGTAFGFAVADSPQVPGATTISHAAPVVAAPARTSLTN